MGKASGYGWDTYTTNVGAMVGSKTQSHDSSGSQVGGQDQTGAGAGGAAADGFKLISTVYLNTNNCIR